MKKLKTGGLELDDEDRAALGYGGADINSPLKHPEGHTVVNPRQYPPAPRSGLLPIGVLPARGDRIFEALEDAAEGKTKMDTVVPLLDELEVLTASSTPIGEVPLEPCVTPRGVDRVAANQLLELLEQVVGGQAIPAREAQYLEGLYRKVFRAPVAYVWLVPFKRRLKQATLQRLNWERRILKLNEREKERYEGRRPPDLLQHAEHVLESTREIVSAWPKGCCLPEWLNADFVAYMIPRVGFKKGGGPKRVLSDAKLDKLLASPPLIIKDLEASPNGAKRWKKTIALLKKEVTNALQMDSVVREAAKAASMPGQGGKRRTMPRA